MIEEEDDSNEKKEVSAPQKAPEVEKKETEKKSFSLPLADASDDWMLDDDVGSMTMEDEEEPKSSKDEHVNLEDKKPQSDEPVSKQEAPVSKPSAEKAAVPKIGS